MQQLWRLIVNDFKLLLRDRGQLISLFLLPLAFILPVSFALGAGDGYGVKAGNNQQPMPLVNFDGDTPHAVDLIANLRKSLWIETSITPEYVANLGYTDFAACKQPSVKCDEALAIDLVKRSRRTVYLVIPAGFSQAIDARQNTTLTLVYDPIADVSVRMMLEGVVKGAATQISLQVQVQNGTSQLSNLTVLAPESLRGPLQTSAAATPAADQKPALQLVSTQPTSMLEIRTPDTYQQTIPGYTVQFVFFLIGYLTSAISAERRSGMYRRLLSMPVKPATLLAGKLISTLLIGLVQVGIMFLVGNLVFKLDLGRDFLALGLLTVMVVSAAVAIGLAASTSRISESVMIAPLIITALLGGCMFPIDLMPPFLRTISYFVPHSWALTGYQTLMVRQQGLLDILPQLGVLALFVLVFFTIAVRRFDFLEL
jgi:ABC-2 type transport system permease protein